MDIGIFILIAILGLIIGSFLNVCIYRMPRSESIIIKGSHCVNCGEKISFYDLIPVISYLLLGGRCRKCKKRISIKYPLVEILNSLLYLFLYIKYGLTNSLYIYAIATSIFIVIAFIDFEFQIIPDRVTILFLIVAVAYRIIGLYQGESIYFLYDGLLAGAGVFIIFLLLLVLSKGGMGGGDVKLVFPMGLLVGIEKIAYLILISSILASIYGIILLILKKANRKTPIPFGTFLAMGIYIIFMLG